MRVVPWHSTLTHGTSGKSIVERVGMKDEWGNSYRQSEDEQEFECKPGMKRVQAEGLNPRITCETSINSIPQADGYSEE